MRRSSVLSSLSAVVLVFGLAACSADAITDALQNSALTKQQQSDVAAAAASMTSEDLHEMSTTGGEATGMASITAAPASGLSLSIQRSPIMAAWSPPPGCSTQDPATGRFVCGTATNSSGLSLDRSFALLDANNTAQAQFDTATTASINLQSHLYGTMTGNHSTATVARWRNVTVVKSPAWDTKRTWSGTGVDTTTAQYSDSTGTRSYDLKANTNVSNVVVWLPRTTYPYPMDGTVTHTFDGKVSIDGNVSASKALSYTATITFNGQHVVPVDVGTGQFCLDLDTGKLVDVNCR